MQQRIQDYVIEDVDDWNYQVRRIGVRQKGKRIGEEWEKHVAYCNSLDDAVMKVAKLKSNSVGGGLKEWLIEYKRVIAEAKKLLEV